MSVPRSVVDVLRDHVTLEVECIDRMYLNVYQAKLQSPKQAASFFRFHRGQPVASSSLMGVMTNAFLRQVDAFVQEHDILNTYEVRENDENIKLFLASPIASPKVRDALQKVADMKAKLATVRRDLGHAEQQLKDIGEDKARLRANLREMPPTAAAYKRYLDKFDKQESEIEALRERIKKLQESELQEKKGLEEYLVNLEVE